MAKPLQIIAHRGDWLESDLPSNSLEALLKAWNAGFGIETDLRDQNGEIVVSHDPAIASSEALTFSQLLSAIKASPQQNTLALNIKSDGLPFLDSHLASLSKHEHFFFDMSIPDLLIFKRRKYNYLVRHSEHEPLVESLLNEASGVWLDCFDNINYKLDNLSEILSRTHQVCIVSPELHGYDHRPLWLKLRALLKQCTGHVLLCTDYPHAASSFFNSSQA